MAVEQVSSGNDDGTNFGKTSSEKIGFYGLTTPIVRPTLSASAVASTVAVSTSTNWGYSGSTQANAIVTLVNELRTDLQAIGLLG